MTPFRPSLARSLALLLLAAAGLPAVGGSLSTSSVAGGSSASAGSSVSSDASSNSSGGHQRAAAGPYRITDVAAVADQPQLLRLRLQAQAADGGALFLLLPQATFAQARLAVGDTVLAQTRPYGLAFARADAQTPFFLVLDDDWHGELPARPVSNTAIL